MEQLAPIDIIKTKPRKSGQNHVLGLRAEPLEKVRIAFIGMGMRMESTLKRFLFIKNSEIIALCDISTEKLARAKKIISQKSYQYVELYSESEDWKRVCERKDIDLIYISTHYDLHVPIAVYAMECGKHVAIEVPAATTIKDCWKLVDTAELTRKHCIQLENCNYGKFEMTILNMIQKGLLGEIIHGEGAYIHDLRKLLFDEENGYWNMWKLKYHQTKNGNLYPTHGFGPICHAMNIHRGDVLDYLVSMSTNHFGLKKYAIEKFGKKSKYAKQNYESGDMNITLIRTKKGKTILLQHDVSSPRPYSRIHLLSGVEGFVQRWPKMSVALAPASSEYLAENELEGLLNLYKHPIRKKLEPEIDMLGKNIYEISKNDGMDYIMDSRLIYCLKNGLPLDQDVYDAAEWSAIVELSEKSVRNYSAPIKIPDFTRGNWNELKEVAYHTVN